MKRTLKAIELMLPNGIVPLADAGSGYLRAFIWKSDADCHFVICREDPDSGELEMALRPSDAEHLAILTAIVANALHYIGGPNTALTDDLGCLAHCLGRTLGIVFDDSGIPKQVVVN